MWLIIVDINLDHLAEVVFDVFLHCKVTLVKWLLTFSSYVYMENMHTF